MLQLQFRWTDSCKLIPQIVVNYRRHDTEGLQPTMMLLWACAGVPLGVYNIVSNFNIALQIQPQILTFLSLVTWLQCKYYGNKWSLYKALTYAVPLGVFMGGLECGLVFALRQARNNDTQWPITLMAVLAAVLLSAGVLRHYWDIYKERTVRGISFMFVAIDALGDLTSLISVLFEPELDVLGLIIYGSELVLWIGVMSAGGHYNLIPWLRQRLEQHRSRRRSIQLQQNQVYQQPAAQASSTVFRTASSGSHRSETLPTAVRLRNVGTDSRSIAS